MTAAPSDPAAPRRALRDLDGGILGGVAAGLAEHLGWPVAWIRAGFAAASLFGGLGVLYYAGLWLVLPAGAPTLADAPGVSAARRGGRSPGRRRTPGDTGLLIALAALVVGVALLLADQTNTGLFVAPILLALTGVALVWRQADAAERDRRLSGESGHRPGAAELILGRGGWASYARLGVGLLLLLAGIWAFALRTGSLAVAGQSVLAAALALAGAVLTIGPWLARLSADLGEERAERVRSQERADVAAHLHDSVLQTLALIQKSAADPATVTRLARAQERDLRTWLFTSPQAGGALADALRREAAAVEDTYGVPVEVVCVGDAPAQDALVQAAREAMVNAAKHSGAPRVDVYAEAGADRTEVFVRDRGAGFDLDAIPEDRQGIRASIQQRIERHGGSARLTSAPGVGTEVELRMENR